MTPRESLAKYGLKTDVKSIRERLDNHTLYLKQLAKSFPLSTQGAYDAIDAIEVVRKADLDLLCEMAEKVEKIGEVIERDMAKKVVEVGISDWVKCPVCGERIHHHCPSCNIFHGMPNFCSHCGTRLE